MTQAPAGRDVKIALSGFDATVTSYIPVYGYETVYVDNGPWYRRRGRHRGWGGYYATSTSETFVPHVQTSTAYVRRAEEIFEENGFIVRATPARYNVEVRFEGPFVSSGEAAAEWAWMICSLLSAEYATQTWTAKLKIYDNQSGRVIHARTYRQKFEDVVWSPLFFVGFAGYTENTYNFMQDWCLSTLTDQALADATAFLAGRK
jgi:hypothetical protein